MKKHTIFNSSKQKRYEILLSSLEATPRLNFSQLPLIETGTGVYVLYHDANPTLKMKRIDIAKQMEEVI